MHATTLFLVVTAAFGATLTLYARNPLDFYKWCMGFQVSTLTGLLVDSAMLIQVGHAGFAIMLYVGTFMLSFPDLWLVHIMCCTALFTRRTFRGCLFDLSANCGFTHTWWGDLYFFLPIPMSLTFGRDS